MRNLATPQRLKGFDYRTPYYYMITIHARGDVPEAFSGLGPQGCILSPVTRAFLRVIRQLHVQFPEIDPVTCFTIMPDHVHLLVRLRDACGHSVIGISEALKENLAQAYYHVAGIPLPPAPPGCQGFLSLASHVFVPGFHDYIVKKAGQLQRFTRYIRTNPQRAWARRQARAQGWFNRVHRVVFMGRTWYAYGNTALLEVPLIVPLKGHRATLPGSPEWNRLLDLAARLGPGAAGVSTFMSAHEKACGRAIGLAGGNWIVLSPDGFPPAGDGKGYETPAGEPTRWHPSERQEKWCARGRMVFLSLWEGGPRRPSRAELYQRCHEMGDLFASLAP